MDHIAHYSSPLGGITLTGDGEALLSDLDGHVVKRWITAEAEAATGE